MSNEKLIEEAAKAIWFERYGRRTGMLDAPDNWATRVTPETEVNVRRESAAALAVFEKAHTPTDDEREALATLVDEHRMAFNGRGWVCATERDFTIEDDADFRDLDRHTATAILAAGFRRSEVPEPSPEKLDYYDPARQDSIAAHDCTFEDGEWWFGHGMPCRHPKLHIKAQGEPSDAQVSAIKELEREIPDAYVDGSWSPVIVLTEQAAKTALAALRAAMSLREGGVR